MKVRKKRTGGPKRVGEQLELIKSEESARERLSDFMDHKEFAGVTKKRGRRLSILDINVRDAERRSKAGDWSGATGKVFVGLYGLCYRIVYGKLPIDIETKGEFIVASRLATMALHKHFNDDADAFVEFIKWSWEREKQRIIWALERGYERHRLIARHQFSKMYIEDYRVYLNNRKRYARR